MMDRDPDLFSASPRLEVSKSAHLSDCGLYRYRLGRRWGNAPPLTFIMLNPSTADADVDDPTIRRCIGFAKREGAGGLVVVNLFGYRATDPAALLTADDAMGPLNRAVVMAALNAAVRAQAAVVCAWGAHRSAAEFLTVEDLHMRASGARLRCLGRTKDGAPRHPLYVPADQPLEVFGP